MSGQVKVVTVTWSLGAASLLAAGSAGPCTQQLRSWQIWRAPALAVASRASARPMAGSLAQQPECQARSCGGGRRRAELARGGATSARATQSSFESAPLKIWICSQKDRDMAREKAVEAPHQAEGRSWARLSASCLSQLTEQPEPALAKCLLIPPLKNAWHCEVCLPLSEPQSSSSTRQHPQKSSPLIAAWVCAGIILRSCRVL